MVLFVEAWFLSLSLLSHVTLSYMFSLLSLSLSLSLLTHLISSLSLGVIRLLKELGSGISQEESDVNADH